MHIIGSSHKHEGPEGLRTLNDFHRYDDPSVKSFSSPISQTVAYCLAKEIKEADAEYVLALKGNQGTAFAEVKAFLDDAIERKKTHLVWTETTDTGHGRVEVRRYWQTQKLERFADRPEWEGLRSVGVVEAGARSTGSKAWNGGIT